MQGIDVKNMIKGSGHTLGDFAKVMGYTHNTLTERLNNWNTKEGLAKISITEAHKWAWYLRMDINELFNLKTKS